MTAFLRSARSQASPIFPLRKLARIALTALLLACAPAHGQAAAQRLSDWLIAHPPAVDDYPLGLSWRVPGEVPRQHAMLLDLVNSLSGSDKEVGADPEVMRRLRDWLGSLPVTGRVRVPVAD